MITLRYPYYMSALPLAAVMPVLLKAVKLKNPVKGILDGLDHLHGKYVHTWFMEQYIDYGEYEFRDEWLVDGYCECYNDLMWENDPLRVKDANRYIVAFMKEWYRDDPGLYFEALGLLQEWASHQFMNMEASLKERVDKDWMNAVTEDEGEELHQEEERRRVTPGKKESLACRFRVSAHFSTDLADDTQFVGSSHI